MPDCLHSVVFVSPGGSKDSTIGIDCVMKKYLI